LVAIVVGIIVRQKWAERDAQNEVDAVIAELDAADPKWRLEDIEAARAVIPEPENAALVVMEIADHLPKPFPARPDPDELANHEIKDLFHRLSEVAPQDELEPGLLWDLRSELKRVEPQLKQARGLIRLSEGRYPITYSKDYFSTRLICEETRQVVGLLKFDAVVRARERDIDGALASTRAAFVAARSVGDEPLTVSQLVRMSCNSVALGLLERTLAQGQGSDASLAELQKLLEDEEAAPFRTW